MACARVASTVEPQFNKPQYNEVLGITNNILQPDQGYSKMYGIIYNLDTMNLVITKSKQPKSPKVQYTPTEQRNASPGQKLNTKQTNKDEIL